MLFEEQVPNERLRRARCLKGLTQSELAEELRTNFETVSRWERGITVPSAYFRERLCSVLQKTPEELGLIADHNEPLAPSTSPCVFLASSYADAEGEFVTDLRAHMQARGVTVLSIRTLRRHGAENQRKALQEAIRTAQAVLLIASPEARSSRHVQKALQIAGIYKSRICAVWIDGENWQECVPSDCGTLFATIDARKNTDHPVFEELIAKLEKVWLASNGTAAAVTTTNASAAPALEPRNPYKGLNAFHREDRHDFFGRDALVDELAGALNTFLIAGEEHAQSARLLAVVGPSGSGKSSVVMAGLLPRLQAGGLPGSQEWVYLDPILPGIHPIESLAVSLAKQLPHRSLKTIREDLEDGSGYGLHLLASYLGRPPETRVVLLIDQFEEVFTQTISEDERQHFIDLLVTAVTEPRGPIILILTLRADFYDRPMHYLELCKLIESNQRLVPPMDLKELREVIEKPAELPDVQLTFEDDLVSDLLFEVQGQTGALPLLQFTLDQLFQRRSEHQMTLKAYHEIGGVKGAVARHAESTYASLPSEEHRKLTRVLFLRLIEPGATMQDTTRRRISRSELLLSNPKETVIIDEVTRAFTTARLLTTNTVSGVATVEVSHEAVIREWPRLADWLYEAREDIHLQQAMSKDATEWQRRGKPKDRLYRGSQLKEARTWAKRNIPSKNEVAFLQASVARRAQYLASMLAIFLLLVSTAALAGWFYFHPKSPNPTHVITLQDDVVGSLRWDIANAPPGSTITFATSLRGRIVLNSELVIKKNLTIHGPGAGTLSITGSGGYNVVTVKQGVTATISGLAFNGTSQTEAGFGIIYNYGTLTLTNVTVSGNTTSNGAGAISNNTGGMLTLTNSTISNNTTLGAYGGGIGNYGGSVKIVNSTISGNRAFAGAGIFNNGGPLTLSNSRVSDNNTSLGGDGGGIYNVDGGTLILSNSTVSGNTADKGWGGGINNGYSDVHNTSAVEFTQGGPLTLINTTISGNRAMDGGGIITNVGSSATLSFCTIYGNIATGKGGGIAIVAYHSNKPSQVEMRSTLVAGNQAPTSPDIVGTLTTDGYNLIQNFSGATFDDPLNKHSTDISGVITGNLGIDPVLRDNGGPTKTLALLPGSPAIDEIPLDACHANGITADQRDVKRPDGNESACDIGAYEYVDEPA